MKLPDFTTDAGLNDLKRKMGISADKFGSFSFVTDPARAPPQLVALLESEVGYESSLDEILVLEDGTLGIKNRRIILYIRDKHLHRGEEELPRFHLSKCSTLRMMWQDYRFGRYVSYSNDNGVFLVNFIRGASIQEKRLSLPVCKNCLDQLSYRGYSNSLRKSQKDRAVAEFDLKDFFSNHHKSFHTDVPRFSFDTAPLDIYPANFPAISRATRQSRGWRCETTGCPSNFAKPDTAHLRRYLHVHHRNGQRYDNSSEDLQCLCLKCHAEQPQHRHMCATVEYKEFLNIWRSLAI